MKAFGVALLIFALSIPALAQKPARGGRGAAQMDSNHDGKISRDEWKGPADMFDRVDTDNNGVLTRDELRQARPNARGGRRDDNPRELDDDHDGKISRQEWKGSSDMFDRLDSNRDGFLTREEMRQNREQFQKQGRGPGRLAQMDTNGDGKISKDEWKGPADMFDRMDANHDGYLTKDDRPDRPNRPRQR